MIAQLLLSLLLAQDPAPQPIYRPGADVTTPRLQVEVKPRYTPEAMAARRQGTVLLEGVVQLDGSVAQVTVVRPLEPGLDAEAVSAFQKWRFTPGTRNGQPVLVRINVELSFKLTDPAAPVLILRYQEPDRTSVSFEIPPERLSQLPAWNPAVSQPPLSMEGALRAAGEWIARMKPRADATGHALIALQLSTFQSARGAQWHYRVQFQPFIGDVSATAPPITVVVLMDGSIVEGQRTPPPPPAAPAIKP